KARRRPVMRNVQAGVLLSVAVILNSAGGCTSTRVLRVARFSPDGSNAQVLHLAPKSAAYRVKYADAGANRLRPLPSSTRIVGRGQPLGFVTADDGRILAV